MEAADDLFAPALLGIGVGFGFQAVQQRRGQSGARLGREIERLTQQLGGFLPHNSILRQAAGRPLRARCYSAYLRTPEPPSPAFPKWLFPALIAACGVFLLGLFSTEMTDPDAWWHLATGRYLVQQHRLPVPDPFAYTTAGAPLAPGEAGVRRFNLTHEWLAQAAWYGIEAAGGFGAVVLWKAALLTLLCGLVGWTARRRTGSWLWGVGAALAAAALATEFAHDRPSILSYGFTAAFVAILEDRRRVWLLPVLSLVWANCHGGFFLGWIVCGAYGLEAVVRRAPDRKRILLAGAAAVLVSGINPNGYAAAAAVLAYRQSPMQATLIEWSRADLWGPPYAFDLLLYGAALCMALAWRRVRMADWLLFGAFAAAALVAFRNEMLIGVAAPVMIAAYAPKRGVPVRYAALAATALLAAATAWQTALGNFFQLRAGEWAYPAGAVEFLRARGIGARVFNTYEDGGYLIWRGRPVFIDGRALSEAVFQDYRRILGLPPGDGERERLLERYAVGAIAINGFEYNSGVLYPLVLALAQPAGEAWKLVYQDAQSMVFLRDVPAGMPVLNKRAMADHLEQECRMHIGHAPGFSLCARTLADLALRAGDQERAKRMLELYLAHPYANDPEARRAYAQMVGR